MKYGKFLLWGLIVFFYSHTIFAAQTFVERKDVQMFINMMVTKHHFNQEKLNELFNNIKLRPEVIQSLERPYEAKPWYIYRQHFLIKTRVDGGVAFWKKHQKALAKAEKEYGVPAQIIVAIIGVESFYGTQRGKYSVLDTLATIGFDYPKRAKYFQNELAEFLILSREQGWNPTKIYGSYAGAVGQPQFMPSSYRAYGIDYSNKNGHVDLFDNEDDIIGSIANYMHKNGWQRNGALYSRASVHGDGYKKLAPFERKLKYTVAELAKYGVKPVKKYPSASKAYLFVVEPSKGIQEYWLAFNNFYVITRYNTSNLYALAVSELSDQIAHDYYHTTKK